MKQHIPNLLTLANLFFGCCAIICLLNNAPIDAFWFSVASFIADAFDGQLARYLKVSSPLGKELDSIADTVSFALVPGVILYLLLTKAFALNPAWMKYAQVANGIVMPALPAFLVTLAGGYRLAKYNVDTRQSDKFLGVPTPANTIFVAGLLMIYAQNPIIANQSLGDILLNPYVIYSLIPILAYWQIAEIPLLNFRFDNWSFKPNQFRYLFFAIAIISVILLGALGLSITIIAYVLISLLDNALATK
jgi:CDP-diacylglycerol---serine O-phosphatidyltransferase